MYDIKIGDKVRLKSNTEEIKTTMRTYGKSMDSIDIAIRCIGAGREYIVKRAKLNGSGDVIVGKSEVERYAHALCGANDEVLALICAFFDSRYNVVQHVLWAEYFEVVPHVPSRDILVELYSSL